MDLVAENRCSVLPKDGLFGFNDNVDSSLSDSARDDERVPQICTLQTIGKTHYKIDNNVYIV